MIGSKRKIDWNRFAMLTGVELAVGLGLYVLCTWLPKTAPIAIGVVRSLAFATRSLRMTSGWWLDC
jgi:hypothetical protein